MKIRMLSFLPQHRELKPGSAFDLADGEHFVSTGEAEAVAEDADAEPDPRPVPEEAAPARKLARRK